MNTNLIIDTMKRKNSSMDYLGYYENENYVYGLFSEKGGDDLTESGFVTRMNGVNSTETLPVVYAIMEWELNLNEFNFEVA